jgi:hypothetical protein
VREDDKLEPAEMTSANAMRGESVLPTHPVARPLDSIESPAELFDEQGSIPVSSPLMQGDVFTGLYIPFLATKKVNVLVVSHPCTMREGATLRDRVTIVRVKSDSRPMPKEFWLGNLNVMPLPGLIPDSPKNYYADFRDIITIDPTELVLSQRIATMTHRGILLLQQRYICAHTRLVVDLPTLHEQALSVMVELELQRDWVEAGMTAANTTNDLKVMDECITAYHEWLDADDKARRGKLRDKTLFADLRKEARREIRLRYSDETDVASTPSADGDG